MSNSDDSSDSSEYDVNANLKRVYIKDIKGRWLHSNSNIGLITVNEAEQTAILSDGTTWHLEERGGTIHMDEYKVVPEMSTLSELIWVYPTQRGLKKCRWFFEDDGPGSGDEKPEEGPTAKRRRTRKKLESDDSSFDSNQSDDNDPRGSDSGEKSADVEVDKERFGVPELLSQFDDWLISTNTPAHEKRIARQGFLKKEFPIKLRGPGIRSLLTKLAQYGISNEQVNHRATGTMIILKEAARKMWIKKHPEFSKFFPNGTSTEPGVVDQKVSKMPEVMAVRERLLAVDESVNSTEILHDAEQLVLTFELLRDSKIGLAMNKVIKNKSLTQEARNKAREVVDDWKQVYRKTKDKLAEEVLQ